MKVITTNLLNRFWKNGVAPIKNSIAGKLDIAKVINNLTTTAAGYALDARQGKILDGKITELNRNMSDLYGYVPISSDTFAVKDPNSIKIIGSIVTQSSGDYCLLLSEQSIINMLKKIDPSISSFNPYRCVVSTTNGDAESAKVHFYEPEWWAKSRAYYQYYYPSTPGSVRAEYQLEYIYKI